jgi:hypothetical protein
LATVEHSIDRGHHTEFHNASILATKTTYMECAVRETIEIELHPYNMKREGVFFSVNHGSPLFAP